MKGNYHIGGDIVHVSDKAMQKEHMRWGYMTDEQLERRLNKITNIEKLTAFYVKAQWTNKPALSKKAFSRYELVRNGVEKKEVKPKLKKKYVPTPEKRVEEIRKEDNIKEFKRAILY